MTTEQFKGWFHQDFVPYVKEKLKVLGEEPKAVLVLDNCSAHPDPEDLVSNDGAIFAKFLPANVTSLIQPMDQGVIEAVKKRYKKKLLGRLIIEEESGKSIVNFLKEINLKVVVDFVHQSWTETTKDTLRKSWRKILPIPKPKPVSEQLVPPIPELAELYYKLAEIDEDPASLPSPPRVKKSRGCGVWKGLRIRISHHDDEDSGTDDVAAVEDLSLQSFHLLFEELGVQIKSDEIVKWLDSDVNDSIWSPDIH